MADAAADQDDRAWVEYSACADADPALFFPTRGQPTDEAKAICQTCVVIEECREWALLHERHGVWGGLSERERRRERRRRRITLPKDPEALRRAVSPLDGRS